MTRRTARTMFVSALTLGLLAGGLATVPAQASAPPPTEYWLALGDSVAFGYAPPAVTPPQKYLHPKNFKGYSEYAAPWYGLTDVNASCPGETTASLIDDTAQSNGCENSPGSDLGYRDAYPLHVAYDGNQLDYATNFVTAHQNTKLVSINIGANDLFLCQETTSDQCTGVDFQTTLNTIRTNLATILKSLRLAGYHKKLVVLEYYSIDYNDQTQTIGTEALNQVLASVAHRFHAILADGFTAFQNASASSNGDPCAAGLLIPLPGGGCNIHPTPLGQIVLGEAIARAVSIPAPFVTRN